jgi:hypothetical protein
MKGALFHRQEEHLFVKRFQASLSLPCDKGFNQVRTSQQEAAA